MDAPWPAFHPVQSLEPSAPAVADVSAAAQEAVRHAAVGWDIPAGAPVAIGVGSRGISNYPTLVRAVVSVLKERGAKPFIVPAMGSHGGATAEAQQNVLAKAGIHERAVGAPVISSMETVRVGATPSGIEVFMDRHAHEAGRVILINRVKQHTSFVACVESGLLKMLSIGLGKLDGAKQYHSAAMRIGFETALLEMGRLLLAGGKIVGGLASIENDRHQTAGVFSTRSKSTRLNSSHIQKSRMPSSA